MTEDQVMEGLERQDRELGLCPESMEGCSIFCFLFYRCGLISSLIIFMFAFYSVFSDIFPISFGTGGFKAGEDDDHSCTLGRHAPWQGDRGGRGGGLDKGIEI
jgi:hypothetical protein